MPGFIKISNAVLNMTLQGLSVETNGDLLLCPNISGDKEHILWIHNGNKMVEWDKMGQEISEKSSQFKNRTQLNTETGDVTVPRVTTADSGLYTAEISIGGQIETFTQQVEVIGKKHENGEFDLFCKCCNKTGSTVTLVCEADGHLLSYSWSGPGLQNPENRNQIQISRENLGSSYTCVVKNPVSEETQNYTAGDCSTRGEEPRASSDLHHYLPSFRKSSDSTGFCV
uniref:Ig-like domain-containing protein n=1 Tax=Denticeps clupeoides TaxID=299321 RepID=A0AAY4EUU4_9TELE